jgi:Chaperone of endosialidase
MTQARDLRNIILGAVVAVSGLSALAAVNLTTFTPNTPIKSAEVNANFSSLKEAVEAPIGASRLDTKGTVADGKVLKLQAGSLAWADDLTGGSGGTAYSAGKGLSLTGTTFSVADNSVTRDMLSTGMGAEGQVLKLKSGNLAWANDLVGSSGSTYSADGSSLVLNGTTFSVKPSGITSTEIADHTVSGSKVLMPLHLSGDNVSVITTIENTNPSGMGLRVDLGNQPNSFANTAIMGQSSSSVGLTGLSSSANGVVGQSTSANGVGGSSVTGSGVSGSSSSGVGVRGASGSNYGVFGSSPNGSGVGGQGSGGYAAEFTGGKFGSGTCYYAGGAGWSCTSDRNKKENFKAVNAIAVLEKLARMPVTRWNMKGDRSKTPHMGPVAQDFKAAFGLGENDTTINTADAQGVMLAAIKGLYEQNQALKARLNALEKSMSSRSLR